MNAQITVREGLTLMIPSSDPIADPITASSLYNAGADKSTPGHHTDQAQASQGPYSKLRPVASRQDTYELYPAGVDKSTSGPLLLGHCKLTLPRRGR